MYFLWKMEYVDYVGVVMKKVFAIYRKFLFGGIFVFLIG